MREAGCGMRNDLVTTVGMAAPRAEVRSSSIFLALLRRDMRVARRELPFFLLRTTLQPLMFVIVFGYLLPRMVRRDMQHTNSSFHASQVAGLATSRAFAAISRGCGHWGGSRNAIRPKRLVTRSSAFWPTAFDLG